MTGSAADESAWQPLSVRRGIRNPVGPVEGVPSGLAYPLRYWVEGKFGYRTSSLQGGMNTAAMMQIAARTGINLRGTGRSSDLMEQILGACEKSEDLFLDVVDATLQVMGGPSDLGQVLVSSNSVWAVARGGRGLERRVDVASVAEFEAALSPADTASAELQEAWSKVYGLHPDPSDAWDHAIKAVEAVLIPVVVPSNPKATLAHVAGELKSQPAQRSFALQSSSTTTDGVGTVEAMLRLMWPNPDRHGGGPGSARKPSQHEAEAVVHLAVTIVQWARAGVLT